jgi:PAS domain S-box-containing protein
MPEAGSSRIGWLAAGVALLALMLLGALLLLETWRARTTQELLQLHARMLASEVLTVAAALPPLSAEQFPELTLERLRQRFGLLSVLVVDSNLPAVLVATGVLDPEAQLRLLDRPALQRLAAGRLADLRVAAQGSAPAYRMVALPLPESSSRALMICDREPRLLASETSQLLGAGGMLALVLALGLALFSILRRPASKSVTAAAGETQLVDTFSGLVADLKAKELDLVQRHEVEHRAAARAQLISASVTDHMPSAAVLLDESGEVRLFNPAAADLFGLEAAAVIGQKLKGLALLDAGLGRFVGHCLAAREPVSRKEITFQRSDGAARVAGLSVSPVLEADGTVHGALCLATDLTVVQTLQRQVQLRNSLASLGELSAGLAHELKNAVSTIRGFAVLARREPKPELTREYADAIVAEAESVNALLEDFLKFARPAALDLTAVDLRELLGRCITELAAEPGMAQARFTLRGSAPPLEADDGLLRGALLNLLRNAVQAHEGSGREPEVVIESEQVGDRVRIAVRDRGCGIPAARRDKVFIPFFTTKQRGTGLGLAIVHKVVVTHGGTVTVQSREGEGTTVLLDLPLRPPVEAPA